MSQVDRPERLWAVYGLLIGPLLGGYLLFDKAFAYLHIPGTPLFVSELTLGVGVLAALVGTRYVRIPICDEPVLTLLAGFALWWIGECGARGRECGVDAMRDSALWYYSCRLLGARLGRPPLLLERLMAQFSRYPMAPGVVATRPGLDAGLRQRAHRAVLHDLRAESQVRERGRRALLCLGGLWVLPDDRSARSRAGWSGLALIIIALSATQNRGGLIGVVAGASIGLEFLRNRMALVVRVVVITAVGLGLASTLSLKVPIGGLQGRDFSAQQLMANVMSLTGTGEPGNLGGTVDGRKELWSRILAKQIADGRLIDGAGFGQNLAAEVGVYDEGKETLRSPHNSHLHILARMGVIGLSLWIGVWVAWYWRLIAACRRLARQGLQRRRQVAVFTMMGTAAILVSSFFDPQLKGPQVAALLWTIFGIGVAVTTERPWFADGAVPTSTSSASPSVSQQAAR